MSAQLTREAPRTWVGGMLEDYRKFWRKSADQTILT